MSNCSVYDGANIIKIEGIGKNCTHNKIINCIVSHGSILIRLVGGLRNVHSNTIVNNTIYNANYAGVNIFYDGGWYDVYNNTVKGNKFYRSSDWTPSGKYPPPAIEVGRRCYNNIITKNEIDGWDSGGAINIDYLAHHNIISHNIICDIHPTFYSTIFIHSNAQYNYFINNSICDCSESFNFTGNSHDNYVIGNTIKDSGFFFLFRTSYNNMIYHNNFINTNDFQDEGDNMWDNGYLSGGNYWSGYDGEDKYHGPNQDKPGSDRIGDTPYPITDNNNVDKYPFMELNGWANYPITIKTIGTPQYDNGLWISSFASINLTAYDHEEGVNTTYYRIWYNKSWSSWNKYTGNFTLNGEGIHYLEYYSIDNARNTEPIHNQTHYVDNTPPSSWIELEMEYSDNIITVYTEFTIWAKDQGPSPVGHYTLHYNIQGPPKSKYYMKGTYHICDGTWYIGPINIPIAWQFRDEKAQMPTGRYNVRYWAIDALGNTESIVHTAWFFADTTDPYTYIIFTGPHYNNDGTEWINQDSFITLKATDKDSGVQSTKYWIDNGPKRTYTGPFTISATGHHIIHYYSTDYVNHMENEQTVSVIVDNTEPSTIINFLGDTYKNVDTTWILPSTSIELISTDQGSGLKGIWYRLNNRPWKIYTAPFSLDEGSYILEFYAEDYLRNTEGYTLTKIGVDNTAPSITMDKPCPNRIYIAGREIMVLSLTGHVDSIIFGPVDINIFARDLGCGINSIDLYIDGEKRHVSYGETLEWHWNKVTMTVHTIEIVAQDLLGYTHSNQLNIWVFNI